MSQQAEIPTLLRTKLHRPQVTSDLVPRPRLLERLNRQRQRPLTLVSAPAGYGKTTLVSSWLEASAWPGAWLSLDEHDDDLVTFLTYFITAIRTLFPAAGRETLALLKAASLPPLPVLACSLTNDLDQIESDFILVLDDYHFIRETAIHDLMNELLRHPPRPMHLVLTTRRDPLLSVGKMRARSQVTEIRSHELRFTVTETADFLQQLTETEIDDATAAYLEEKTEGWVTGLRLTALSLRHGGDLNLVLSNLPENTPYVTEYLVAETLELQSQAITDFLLKTSILDQLHGPLCAFVTGLDEPVCNGQAYLKWLHQENLFIIPLDGQHQWYRYHHLFQQLLRERLERQFSPAGIADLHTRASAWFAQNGLIEEALHHTLAAFGNEKRGARNGGLGQERIHPSSFSFQPLLEPLTDRELEILALLAQRLSNKEIAAQLVISPGTVTQHTHNIYQKLNVEGRRQAVSKAAEIGILLRE